MTGPEAAASAFGGLGLFFVAIRELSGALRRLAGPGLRRLMLRASGGPARAALTGLGIGVVTQSSSAATFVTTSLLSAGLVTRDAAFTAVAWSNVGPAALVLLATVDLRLAALWLIGGIGFASVLGFGTRPGIKALADACLAMAVALLALSMVRGAGALLNGADPAAFQSVVSANAHLVPFLAAVAIAALVQSSSTPTILAIKLAEAGLLSFDQLSLTVYGASLGSGLALLFAGRSLRGTARQVIYFQALFKAAGALLFILLWELEVHSHLPLIGHAAQFLGHDNPGSVAILFLMVQVVGCLALAPLWPAFVRLVSRLAPPTAAEALGRPAFIYPQAVQDQPSALDLATRELARLQHRLPQLLDGALDHPDHGGPAAPGGPAAATLQEGSSALEAEIKAFLADVLAQECAPPDVARAVTLETWLDHLRALRETIFSLTEILAAANDPIVRGITGPMAESLHFLLVQLTDAADAADDALLRDLCEDRGEMMEALRRRATQSGQPLAYAAQDQLFRATTLFERAVWLVRRRALATVREP